jgi:hypothetical protein
MLKQGPLKYAIENTEGVISQELITLRVRDGQLVKETVTRRFNGDDYHDCSSYEPVIKLEEE